MIPRGAVVACVCAIAVTCGDGSNGLTDDEYAVLSAAIAETVAREPFAGPSTPMTAHRPVERIVIAAVSDPEAPTRMPPVETDGVPMDPSTLANYVKPDEPIAFERRFDGIGEYTLLPISELFSPSGENVWHDFHARFPGAPGLIAVSRVGFSNDRDEAVVYLMIARGGTDGHADALVFRRDGTGWRLAGRRRLEDY